MFTQDEIDALKVKAKTNPMIAEFLADWDDARDGVKFYMSELSQENLSESDTRLNNYLKGAEAGKMIAFRRILVKLGESK